MLEYLKTREMRYRATGFIQALAISMLCADHVLLPSCSYYSSVKARISGKAFIVSVDILSTNLIGG